MLIFLFHFLLEKYFLLLCQLFGTVRKSLPSSYGCITLSNFPLANTHFLGDMVDVLLEGLIIKSSSVGS